MTAQAILESGRFLVLADGGWRMNVGDGRWLPNEELPEPPEPRDPFKPPLLRPKLGFSWPLQNKRGPSHNPRTLVKPWTLCLFQLAKDLLLLFMIKMEMFYIT